VVCERQPAPIVVGGQAVNLWAINYLVPKVPKSTLVSKDLDVVVGADGIAHLKGIPGWVFEPQRTRNWMDSRLGFLKSTSSDGRPLLVEVLHSVHGLDKADLASAAFVNFQGAVFRVLDPVAMLKAKTANVRDIDQAGPPPRHDRQHLQLIARCVPPFLRDVHEAVMADQTKTKEALSVFSRLFKTLQQEKITDTLFKEGITPRSLLPKELAQSPVGRIRRAYEWQMKSVPTAPRASVVQPSVAAAPKPKQGPKLSP
jgi:hypothetical protein